MGVTGRIVCAAIRHKDTGVIILGVRHFDLLMHKAIEQYGYRNHPFDQGFVNQRGDFLTRGEAFLVAKEAGQIRKKTGNVDVPELYSEDLY